MTFNGADSVWLFEGSVFVKQVEGPHVGKLLLENPKLSVRLHNTVRPTKKGAHRENTAASAHFQNFPKPT
jgi:hypothetical protein